MTDSALSSVNLQRYGELLDTLLHSDVCMALRDRCDETLLTHGSAAVIDVGVEPSTSPERVIVRECLTDSLDEPIGTLIAVLEEQSSDPDTARKLSRALSTIGACVVCEYELNRELDTMAGELAERYEELNLIYGIEEQASKYDPERGRGVIEHLVDECLEFLGVDAVVFRLSSGDLQIERSAEGSSIADKLFASLAEPLQELVANSPRTVVMNEPDDERWKRFGGDLKIKLLAAPVTDVNGGISGVLALLNGCQKADFNNGHRRLVDILAEQASAILQANQDVLTGLLNRRGFEDRVGRLIAAIGKDSLQAERHTLLHLNLDQFHLINDTYGHVAGDALLKELADMITAEVRNTDVAARLSGDEFSIVLCGCPPDRATVVAQKLIDAVRQHRFCWDGKVFNNSLSIGIATVSQAGATVAEVMSAADAACYVAKSAGRNRLQHFDRKDIGFNEHYGQMQWVPRIRSALDENRFELHAQPITSIGGPSGPSHFEILLRMVDEHRRLVAPSGFLPAAERYHMMSEIDRLVVRTTLAEMVSPTCAMEQVWCAAINISGQSLTEPAFQQFVADEFDRSGIEAQRVCFEITETAAIGNFVAALSFIESFRERGCRFSLDDFGTGLSSFAYLKRLPVDYLKIDGAFVREMARDRVSMEMVRSINQIGHVMGLQTIAEFVEDEDILQALERIGVDYAQGYWTGKPRPLTEQLEQFGFSPDPVSLRTANG